MKKSATNLLMLLCIGAFAIGISSIASSCSKDDDGGGGDSAKDICDIDQCQSNSALKDACIEKVKRCLELDQSGHDECVLIAIDACGI